MSIAIGTIIPPQLRKQGMQKVAEFARETGLSAIDLPEIDVETAQICHEHGLRIGTVNVSGLARLLSPDAEQRRVAIEDIGRQIRQAAKLGARVIFMCLVPENRAQPVPESLGYFADTFPSVAEVCESAGVKIAFEGWPGPGPHYPTLGYTPEVWRAMFAAVPSRALGLCFDPSHLVRLGIDYLRVLKEFEGRIHHCHGKDTEWLSESRYLYGRMAARLDEVPGFSEGPWRYCVPGAGEVDWGAVAFQLERGHYDGCIAIELEDARYWGTVEKEQQGIRKAHAHLARHFG